jgi:hypothetical protein
VRLSLLSLLLLSACHARLDPVDAGDRTDGTLAPVTFDFLGGWSFSYDAEPSTDPTAMVLLDTSTSITVDFKGSSGCGCSAQHKVFQLPRAMPCPSTVMSFDWDVGEVFDATDSTALRIDFNPKGNHYQGDRGLFTASTWSGNSACAWSLANSFPSPPRIQRGHNQIALGDLSVNVDGFCTLPDTFESIDVHVEGYTCNGEVVATLSNLQLE